MSAKIFHTRTSHARQFHLRPYRDTDLEDSIALWLAAWQHTYPDMDFKKRVEWWRNRWLNELLPVGEAIVAEDDAGIMIGFVILTPATGYMDQLAVDVKWQGSGLAKTLLDYVKGRSNGLVELHVNESNVRAVRFYQREGFKLIEETTHPGGVLPVYKMLWQDNPSSYPLTPAKAGV